MRPCTPIASHAVSHAFWKSPRQGRPALFLFVPQLCRGILRTIELVDVGRQQVQSIKTFPLRPPVTRRS